MRPAAGRTTAHDPGTPKAMRVRETRAWRRDWAEGDAHAETERHTLEWMHLRSLGRRTLELIEAVDGPLGVWHS